MYANVPLPLQISGFLSADINWENLKAHDESIVFMQDLSNRFVSHLLLMLPLSKSFLQHNVSNTCINSTWLDSIQGWKQNNTMILSLGYIAMAFLCQPGAAAGSSQVRNSDSDGFTRNGTAKLGTSKPARLSKSQHVSASLSKSALISCWLRCLTSPSSTTARMTSFCKIGMWSSLRAGSKRHRFLWDAMILWISWPECCPALARKINKRIYRII